MIKYSCRISSGEPTVILWVGGEVDVEYDSDYGSGGLNLNPGHFSQLSANDIRHP